MKFSRLCKGAPALSLFWLGLLLLTACGDFTATPTPAIQNAAQPTANTQPSTTTLAKPTAPTANLTPAPTLANTSSLASTAILECRTEDLEVKTTWNYSDNFRDNFLPNIGGTVSFTNHGTSPCNLPGTPQFSIIDSKNRPIALTQVNAPTQEAKIQPDQTLLTALSITNCSKFFDIAGKDTITLKLSLDSQLNFSITTVAIAEALPECKYTLLVGPFETVAGKAFTATAEATEATARSHYLTEYAATQAYQTAHPPTPTPSPTAIPTIVPNAKSCNAKNLKLEEGMGNGAAGFVWSRWYLVNQGTSVCTLKGYPTLEWLDSNSQPLLNTKYDHISSVLITPMPEAATPLIGLIPGAAAMVENESYRCDGQYDQETFKVNLVLPDGQGKIYVYDVNKCPTPKHVNPIAISSFEYAPGNWREQP